MTEQTDASVPDPWPVFDDPRTDVSMHTVECLDYADYTAERGDRAYCILPCADARREALNAPSTPEENQ